MTDNDVRRIEDKVDGVTIALARLEGSLSPSLQKLTDSQDDLESKITDHQRATELKLDDHEVRLRASERFRFAIPSVSVVALLLGVIEAAYYLTHLHH